jgi:hypothetical protein
VNIVPVSKLVLVFYVPFAHCTNWLVKLTQQHKVNGAKDAILFNQHFSYNFSATNNHIFAHIFQMPLPLKA